MLGGCALYCSFSLLAPHHSPTFFPAGGNILLVSPMGQVGGIYD